LQLPILPSDLGIKSSQWQQSTGSQFSSSCLRVSSAAKPFSPKKSGSLSILAMPFMAVGRCLRRPARRAQHHAKAVIMRLVAVQMSMNANMMPVLTSIFAVPLVCLQPSFSPGRRCLLANNNGYDRQGRIARRRSKTSPSARTRAGACSDRHIRVDTSAVWRVKWVLTIVMELDSDLAVMLQSHIQVHS
jgi:hypothetical protein